MWEAPEFQGASAEATTDMLELTPEGETAQ
jgi:hypothetical protein